MTIWLLASRPSSGGLLGRLGRLAIRYKGVSSMTHVAVAFEIEPGNRVVAESVSSGIHYPEPFATWAANQRVWQAARLDVPNPRAAFDYALSRVGTRYDMAANIGQALGIGTLEDPTRENCVEYLNNIAASGDRPLFLPSAAGDIAPGVIAGLALDWRHELA